MCPATDRVVKPQVPAALPVPLPNSHGLPDIGFLSRGPSAWVLQVCSIGHDSFPRGSLPIDTLACLYCQSDTGSGGVRTKEWNGEVDGRADERR